MRRPFNGLFDRLPPEKYYELARRIALRDRMRGLRVKMYLNNKRPVGCGANVKDTLTRCFSNIKILN